ncbi:hypothetical protein BLA60_00375 [Actinophytocola xinjiangensis]|uniref:Uncharacterized protein n=1 Tax=Actinophytocola xinjiangensis TaxID=485602 RepID=A0A7Z0WQW9_9PSEU|nr:hypothetical protein BLA60_00375 [Actinophytocola xinjiangensis]
MAGLVDVTRWRCDAAVEAAGRLGGWAAGRLGGWAAGRLGGWAAGRLGGWAAGRLGGPLTRGCAAEI